MNKVNSNNKPTVIEKVGNGTYLYHWDIKEVQISDGTNGTSTHTGYEYFEVKICEQLSCDAITKAVINEVYPKDTEQKLINDYNGYVLGILDESYLTAYKAFISGRKVLKDQIKSDWEAYCK